MVYHKLQCFCTDTFVPIGLSHPVADEWFTLAGRQVTFTRGAVAHSPNRLSSFLQLDGPCVQRIVKYGADNLQTLLHTLMRRPSCTRPNIWIGSPLEQRLRITVSPRAQYNTICFHCHFICCPNSNASFRALVFLMSPLSLNLKPLNRRSCKERLNVVQLLLCCETPHLINATYLVGILLCASDG